MNQETEGKRWSCSTQGKVGKVGDGWVGVK